MTETATYPVPEPAEPPRPSGRRTTLIAGVTAATLVVVGGGAFAAVHFLASGDDADQALPASAVAVASINLDPGAAQKVEALKTLRKFPGLRKQLGISSTGDLRRAFFDEAVKDGHCKNLSYDADIEPWIGESAAVAAVPFTSGKVTPVIALAVTDEKKASAAFTKLNACASAKTDKVAWAYGNGFALLSDSQAHADDAVKEAKSKPLADDAAYQEWTGKAGDRGVVNFYVAKRAAQFLADKAGSLVPPTQFPSDLPSSEVSGSGTSAPFRRGDDNSDKIKKALENFQGAAGAVRFADGGMELEVVSGGLPGQQASNAGGTLVASLPKDTAAAVGVAVPSDFAAKLVSNLKSLDIPFLGDGGSVIDQLQSQLGLSLPQDLQSILGQGIALSVGGTAPSDLSQLSGPDSLPAGLSVKGGDADKIKEVVGKLEQQAGGSTGALNLHVEQGSGKVALSFDPDYADSLKASGSLGDQKRFSTVVPHAKDAQFVAFADFDSDWATTIAKNGDAQTRQNLAPLEALGLSAWRDGGTSHLLLKVTTD